MGNSKSSLKNNTSQKIVYCPHPGPPNSQFSHWQMEMRVDCEAYRFVPVYVNATSSSPFDDNPKEKAVKAEFFEGKFRKDSMEMNRRGRLDGMSASIDLERGIRGMAALNSRRKDEATDVMERDTRGLTEMNRAKKGHASTVVERDTRAFFDSSFSLSDERRLVPIERKNCDHPKAVKTV